MTLYEFITYCQLKGYVEDQWKPLAHGTAVRTVLLTNKHYAATITFAADPTAEFVNTYNLRDFKHTIPWIESDLDTVIKLIAPELL